MDRSDLDAEIAAADQELSALLEKHINAPMKRSIDQASGGLSLTLKGDFETSVLSLRSELKKLNGAFEDLGDDLGNVRQVSKRIEAMVQQAEGAQDGRFEKAGAQVVESSRQLAEALTGVEERLSKLGAAQLHHLGSALKVLSADLQAHRAQSADAQQNTLAKLDELASAVAAQQAQALIVQRQSKQRFIWVCAALAVNLGVVVTLLVKAFL
jgi:septal ring factor EnvC (AmiA/AmiB activator)